MTPAWLKPSHRSPRTCDGGTAWTLSLPVRLVGSVISASCTAALRLNSRPADETCRVTVARVPKEYTPPRDPRLACVHHDHDCDTDTCTEPTPCPGLCPKLVIKSWAPQGQPQLGPLEPDGTPVVHAILFSEQEIRTFVREADRGYFDLPDMPERKDSRFYDPLTSMLIQALQEDPLRALGILLFLGNPQAVAFTAEPPTLAVRDSEGSWLYLHLDAETLDEWTAPEPDPDAAETAPIEFPDPVSHHDTPPEGAAILWERPTRETTEEDTRYDITDDGSAALDA